MNRYSEILKKLINKFNFKIEHKNSWYKRNEHLIAEISDDELKIIKQISNYSMSTPANHWAIIQSIKHISQNNIKGDIVESGVWRGGNLILFKIFLDKYNLKKKIFAYDTFEGMSEPEKLDKTFDGKSSIELLKKLEKKNVDRKENILIADCSIEQVIKNFNENVIKNDLITIKGKVEETLLNKDNLPSKISLLRLDTDWYSSTKIELEILYPLLEKNGILIIDDYGYWQGARKAVDEYFLDKKVTIFKIDFTGRMIIKT